MSPNTHLSIDRSLCGEPVRLADGVAEVALVTDARMVADARGLVHGGFVFGLADYAAMLAVNHPNVVLGSAEVRFLKPVRAGERVVATATAGAAAGKKREVAVEARVGDALVFTGTFRCAVLERHVLEPA